MENIPFPPQLEEEFLMKDVRFFMEQMHYGYKPSRKRKFVTSNFENFLGIKRYAMFIGLDP